MSGESELAEWSWVYVGDSQCLHHPAIYGAGLADDGHVDAGTTTCGRTGGLQVPGIFSRLGAPRCGMCCAILGYPRGVGSPKNDDRCRPLVEARLAALDGAS